MGKNMRFILFLFLFTKLSVSDSGLSVAEQHARLHKEAHEKAVQQAQINAQKRHSSIPGDTVTVVETVETVHTEVKDTASNKVLSNEIKITKTKENEDGTVDESHFEAKIELDDELPAIETETLPVVGGDESYIPDDVRPTLAATPAALEDAGPDTAYEATPPPIKSKDVEWPQLVSYCILFSLALAFFVHF